jgi:hypothetical protein
MSTLRPEAANQGHHTQKGWRGVWVSAGLDVRGRISCADKEGEGAPGYVGGGGQVRCRWWFVTLLIDKGEPKVA